MKFFKILFISLFSLILLCIISLFVFMRTFDVNKFRPQIVKAISQSLGRSADIGQIAFSISFDRGVTLGIKNLSVADNPQFSKENFISIKNIRFGIDLSSLLAKKELRISRIDVNSPKITIIRDANGRINAEGLGKKESAAPAPSVLKNEVFSEVKKESASPGLSPDLPMSLLIQSAEIKDGVVTFIDKTSSPAMSLEIADIQVALSDFSLEEPSNFSLEASFLSPRRNIKAKGRVGIDINGPQVYMKDITVRSDLSDLSLSYLEQALGMLKGVGLKDGFEGTLEADIDELVANQGGLAKLLLNGRLTDGEVIFDSLPYPAEKINAKFTVTEKDVIIKDASLQLASGQIQATGFIKDYLKSQELSVKMNLKEFDLAKMIPKNEDVELQGQLSGKFDLSANGLDPQTTLNSLAGQGRLEVKEGKLLNINILKLVLSKMSMLPRLVEKLVENLPEEYKKKLEEKDTVLKQVKFETALKGQKLFIKEAIIDTDTFRLTGEGELGFDQTLFLGAALHIPADLTQGMVKTVEELQYLVDEAGEIMIPVKVSGKIPALVFFPDMEYLGKKVILNRGRKELEKVLDKVFGKDEEAPVPPAETDGQPPAGEATTPTPTEEKQKSPEQQLIEGILDQIFH